MNFQRGRRIGFGFHVKVFNLVSLEITVVLSELNPFNFKWVIYL